MTLLIRIRRRNPRQHGQKEPSNRPYHRGNRIRNKESNNEIRNRHRNRQKQDDIPKRPRKAHLPNGPRTPALPNHRKTPRDNQKSDNAKGNPQSEIDPAAINGGADGHDDADGCADGEGEDHACSAGEEGLVGGAWVVGGEAEGPAVAMFLGCW